MESSSSFKRGASRSPLTPDAGARQRSARPMQTSEPGPHEFEKAAGVASRVKAMASVVASERAHLLPPRRTIHQRFKGVAQAFCVVARDQFACFTSANQLGDAAHLSGYHW